MSNDQYDYRLKKLQNICIPNTNISMMGQNRPITWANQHIGRVLLE